MALEKQVLSSKCVLTLFWKVGVQNGSNSVDFLLHLDDILESSRCQRNWGKVLFPTVDGSEIRRSPVEVGSLSHDLQGFIYPRWLG